MAKAQDIMTANPASCHPDTPIVEIARMMVDEDCGLIPVTGGDGKLMGVVTDRDIVVRLVAKGQPIGEAKAQDCMSANVRTCTPDDSIEKVSNMMEEAQVRRVPIVDAGGALVGIVAMADLARESPGDVKEAIREVSEPAA